jgi:PBP1b-binding outer membrane lipoprotein LpoB
MEGQMRVLTVLAIALLIAACSATASTTSQHPGQIGGEQAVKNDSLATN